MMARRTATVTAAALAALAAGAALVPAASGSPAHAAKRATKKVSVADNVFSPTGVKIARGSAINWVWSSSNYNTHNVVLLKGPKGVKKFRSIDGTRNLSFKHTFTTAGTYRLVCTIHTGMVMTVTVK